MKNYCIAWLSKTTLKTGQGTILFTEQEAIKIASKLNDEVKGLVHWAKRIESEVMQTV